jgi:hypothetical protein
MAQYRQSVSAGGLSEDDLGGHWDGFWKAMKDPFSHLFAAIHFSLIIAQSYKDFFPSVRFTLKLWRCPLSLQTFPDCENPWL